MASTNTELPPDIESLEGEFLRSRRRANRTQHNLRAVGGHLYLTNFRVIFRPHGVDAPLDGEYWWARLTGIVEVGRQKKELRAFFGGGLRDRLKIVLHNGSTELFVVNKLGDVIEQIQSAASRGHPS